MDSVYGVVHDRVHTIYAPYTTVFGRDRIRRNRTKYGDRIGSITTVNDRVLKNIVARTIAFSRFMPKGGGTPRLGKA